MCKTFNKINKLHTIYILFTHTFLTIRFQYVFLHYSITEVVTLYALDNTICNLQKKRRKSETGEPKESLSRHFTLDFNASK